MERVVSQNYEYNSTDQAIHLEASILSAHLVKLKQILKVVLIRDVRNFACLYMRTRLKAAVKSFNFFVKACLNFLHLFLINYRKEGIIAFTLGQFFIGAPLLSSPEEVIINRYRKALTKG